eukprot:gene12158-biopygen278
MKTTSPWYGWLHIAIRQHSQNHQIPQNRQPDNDHVQRSEETFGIFGGDFWNGTKETFGVERRRLLEWKFYVVDGWSMCWLRSLTVFDLPASGSVGLLPIVSARVSDLDNVWHAVQEPLHEAVRDHSRHRNMTRVLLMGVEAEQNRVPFVVVRRVTMGLVLLMETTILSTRYHSVVAGEIIVLTLGSKQDHRLVHLGNGIQREGWRCDN